MHLASCNVNIAFKQRPVIQHGMHILSNVQPLMRGIIIIVILTITTII